MMAQGLVGSGPGAALVVPVSGSAWVAFPVGPLLPMDALLPRLSSQTSPNIVLTRSCQELPDPVFPLLKH